MRIYKRVISIAALLFTFSVSAYAGTCSHKGCGGCGGGGGTLSCDQTETYSESFTTDNFTTDMFEKNYEFGFDAITAPGDGFEITSVFLTVKTNSNGYGGDAIKGKDGFIWRLLGYLDDTDTSLSPHALHTQQVEQVFELSSLYFDDVLNGISFKAVFSQSRELITFAELTVNGKYCPTSAVPIPGAAIMFAPALLGMIGLGRRKKS